MTRWSFRAGREACFSAGLRAAERVLPRAVLHALLWPIAAFMAAAGFVQRLFRRRGRMPWPATLRSRWRDRTRLELSLWMLYWRDRLPSPRWRRRCPVRGLEHLPVGRPVVLATLHFGPLGIMPTILRMHGLRAAVLAAPEFIETRPPSRTRVDALEEKATGIPPRLIPAGELWETEGHLKNGGVLVFATDGATGARTQVSSGDLRASLGRGLLRMAHITGAVVAPCLVTAGPGFSAEVRIGKPLPNDLVADRTRHQEAYDTLFAALIEGVRESPGQCRSLFWRAIRLGEEQSESAPAAAEARGSLAQ